MLTKEKKSTLDTVVEHARENKWLLVNEFSDDRGEGGIITTLIYLSPVAKIAIVFRDGIFLM